MKFIHCLLFFTPTLLASQSDTVKTLPQYEVTSQRINHFAVGEMRLDFDSLLLKTAKLQNLADFLQNNTPLSIKAYGTGLSTVSARGTGSSHTAIVWNGFNIQNPLNGLADLPLFEMGSFEHVGVKFGGNSALYGSGAIGGAIYLDNDIAKIRGFHGNLGFNTGSFGLFGENLSISTGSEKLAAAFRLSHQISDNGFLFKNIAEIGKPIQRMVNAAFEKFNLSGSLFFNLTKNSILKVNAWDSRNNRQISPTMTAQNDKARLEDATSRLAAEYAYFKNQNATKLRMAYFDEDNLYRSNAIDSSRNRAKTTVAEIEHYRDFNNKNTLRFGLNFTKNTALTRNFNEIKNRSRLAAFAAYQFEIVKTKFSFNTRQELVDGKLIPFTYSFGFEKLLESLKLSKSYTQSEIRNLKSKIQIRASFSRNYNLPALNDLYWAQLGNPNLKAENGFSGEMGADFPIKQSKLSLTVFKTKTKDWIQWSPQADGLWHPFNINTVISQGIETFFKTHFIKNKVKYEVNAHYQLADSRDFNKKYLLYTPVHTGGATVRVLYKNSFFQYNQTASSRRYATTDNSSWANPFTIGNMSTGTDLKLGKFKTTVQLKVLNVFNTDYQVIPFYANARQQFLMDINGHF
jgi:vitamin B12 transporter